MFSILYKNNHQVEKSHSQCQGRRGGVSLHKCVVENLSEGD